MSEKTFFGRKEYYFPPIPEDKNILSVPYIEAARQILPFFDKLGKAFSFVRKDVQGNVDHLDKKYKTNPEKFTTIRAMLEDERDNKNTTYAQIGALWLKRGLEFIRSFFINLLEDDKAAKEGKQKRTEDIQPLIMKAYKDTLEVYHGFIVKNLFKGVTKLSPSRASLLKALFLDEAATEDLVIEDIQTYLVSMIENINNMDALLKELGFDAQEKV